MRELLDDLREDLFLRSIRCIAQDLKEVYPNTNLIAYIRECSEEIKRTLPSTPIVLELPMSEAEREKNRQFAQRAIREIGEKLGFR